MDNTRLLLVVALCFLSLLLWDAWQRDYGHRGAAPDAPAPAHPSPPAAPADGDAPVVPLAEPAAAAPASAVSDSQRISVMTDVLDLDLDLNGGGIARLALPAYPVSLEEAAAAFKLMGSDPDRVFIEQGGLTGEQPAPDHHAVYAAGARVYELAPDQAQLQVQLVWANDAGIEVIKAYTFERGSYSIDVRYLVANKSAQPWRARLYDQLQRSLEPQLRTLIYTFTGPAISTPEKRYEKFDFDDLEDTPIARSTENGWIAILQHYFVAALLPPATSEFHYYSKILSPNRYLVGFYGDAVEVPAGGTASFQTTIYAGPKLQHVLERTAPGLELTVDYGVLWFIAKPLYLVLELIKKLTGNWGWAIVLLTLLIKLLFYPLSAAGYRSMAKMRRVQPRLLALKDRYANDRARMNQAMMELYKEEKINPLGGCFPILIQIPVFISLYWVLLETVELRQAPFVLWIDNLSAKDPYFVLPLLMGVSMWFQQKLNPAPIDPVQQKVMQILPIVFTVFFAFFPSGLVLYWVVNNVLSIAQQWNITRTIEREGIAA